MPLRQSPFDHIPAQARPGHTSTELFQSYLQRYLDAGGLQKVIAYELDVRGPNISNWRAGSVELPLPRLRHLSRIFGLSDQERAEWIYARLVEMHGQQGQFCLETAALWAQDAFAPIGDDAVLLALWAQATAPAPHLLNGLLSRPNVSERVRGLLSEIAQEELSRLAAEASE